MEKNFEKGNILEVGQGIGKVIVMGNCKYNDVFYALVCKMQMEEEKADINLMKQALLKIENDVVLPVTDKDIVRVVVPEIFKKENIELK